MFTLIPIQSKIALEDISSQKSYLILTNIDQTPPHCSLICHGFWYSLGNEDCKVNVPFQTLHKIISFKNIPVIFLELLVTLNSEIVQNIYSRYQRIDFQNHITCITPIKEILNAHHIVIPENAFLFEMIELLYHYQKITISGSYNYHLNEYKLKHYSCLPMNTTISY